MQSFRSNPTVEFHQDDIRDYDLLESCIKQADYVFHMAALRINACAADPAEGFKVMSEATFKLADFSRLHDVKKVIYSSSASVYGLAQNFPTPETDNPYDNRTFYGASKLWGEQLFRSFKHMYGLHYVGFRYFNVYGPRMDTDGKYTEVMIKWLDCIRDNRSPLIYGDGSASMDFVFVKDVAKANILGLLSERSDEIYNVGNQVKTSLKQLLDTLLKVNGSVLVPEFREDNTVNPVPRRLADLSKIKEHLGFTPDIDLENGLQQLSSWYFTLQD
jgi:UDP-glucose 4-epimerase